jgi:probable rRNA maturation factor
MNVEVAGAAIPRFTRREIIAFTRRVLIALGAQDREASIAFVDDASMKTLNRQFRGKNKTTDVLTVPADDTYADPAQPTRPLGDIVISVEQARRQAADEKHSLATEVRYLIVHGVIHALGYDHETDNGEMNALEEKVRGVVGLE